MSKVNVSDEAWKLGAVPTKTAMAINTLVAPVSVAIAPLFNDLERRHGLKIRLSWTGVIAERDGDVVFEKGRYTPAKAVGHEQCAQQRAYAYMLLRWCCTHYPTELLQQHKGWLYGQ
ncbi:hypothetical protein [Cronobacter phage JC01]|uniref:Uncharacterized protein n=1 Tax=Cronobacter phage JC01 TaxID=2729575 RepID=A0A6M3YKM2_9CAUD|nr:hypothetical protein JT331_gp61 [Cronobacter phage JC01]QJI52281.1 hypothetical protein [Cronobacter phage JC01]